MQSPERAIGNTRVMTANSNNPFNANATPSRVQFMPGDDQMDLNTTPERRPNIREQ